MLREFVDVVSKAVDDGYDRGIDYFLESLDKEIQMDKILENVDRDRILSEVFESAGYRVRSNKNSTKRDKLDKLIQLLDDELED